MTSNKIKKIEREIVNPKVAPKTVSIHHLQDNNLKALKNTGGQQLPLNKIKTMATTQTFKKIA